jgi:hypothetical protein
MKRLIGLRVLILGGVILAALIPVSSASGAGEVVVLGAKEFTGSYGYGFGTEKPKRFFNGGDPSGLVSNIHWRNWGAPTAIGHGLTSIFKPQGGYYRKLVRIKLQARGIGTCDGKQAYQQLRFRVPHRPGGPLGGWHLWSGTSSICTAPF